MTVSGAAAFQAAYTHAQVQTELSLRALEITKETGRQMVNLVEQTTQAIAEAMAAQLDDQAGRLDVLG
jgi:hypothetical protein